MASEKICIAPSDFHSATLPRWIEAIQELDEAGWPLIILRGSEIDDPLDGLSIAAYCAPLTKRIGLCAGVDPKIVEPFTLARGLSALDHLSRGRAAWYFTAGIEKSISHELVQATQKLLLSWEADALVEDAENGRFSDSDSVHRINYEGKHFSVTGPLSTPRPPQGATPFITQCDQAFAADIADFLLTEDCTFVCSLNDIDEALKNAPPPKGGTVRQNLGIKS